MPAPSEPEPSAASKAPFERRASSVLGNEPLGAYRVLRLADPGPAPVAGQFAMLAATERWGGGEDERPFLPRAFSYARWLADPSPHASGVGYRSSIGGEAHFLLEDVGPGTRRLCELTPGEEVWLLGPLGRGFTPPTEDRRALLVGGGVGIAPLAILQDELSEARSLPGAVPKQRNRNPSIGGRWRDFTATLLGFRDADHAAGAALLAGSQIATDDGSIGSTGLVTDLLAAELERDAGATVYACGPPAMLEAVRALCAEWEVPAQLALEAGMACGFGACYGCVVPTRDGYARVCVDGPVLDAAELECVHQPGTGVAAGSARAEADGHSAAAVGERP